jgi:Uma2 family endonuclease
MARAVDTIEQRLFTVEEYHRMAEAGILSPDERVELIRGVIHAMSPKKRPHVVGVTGALKLLEKALEGRASVYPKAPLVLEELDSEPEPDVMVCSNPDFRAYGTEATRALLVVEIADSSRSRDLGVKVALYAEAGVPEYWVVDLAERRLVAFRDPRGGGYQSRSTLDSGARVSPVSWPDIVIDVAALLPDLTPL